MILSRLPEFKMICLLKAVWVAMFYTFVQQLTMYQLRFMHSCLVADLLYLSFVMARFINYIDYLSAFFAHVLVLQLPVLYQYGTCTCMAFSLCCEGSHICTSMSTVSATIAGTGYQRRVVQYNSGNVTRWARWQLGRQRDPMYLWISTWRWIYDMLWPLLVSIF